MNYSNERLVVLDADGTTVNAFEAIDKTFSHHRMQLGDMMRFQKRHNIFKYLGGLKEFPANLRKQINKKRRKALIATLTEVYREEGELYACIADMIQTLIDAPGVRVGVVSRNITLEPLLNADLSDQPDQAASDGIDTGLGSQIGRASCRERV